MDKIEKLRKDSEELGQSVEVRKVRNDGYQNMLNRYGTQKDTSERTIYIGDQYIPYQELTDHYLSDGLFAKIIDYPADEIVKHDFSLGIEDDSVVTLVKDVLDEIDFKHKLATAVKWSRLYGGCLAVMMVDDGRTLEQPINWNRVKGIDELLVFEKPLVVPDYTSLYMDYGDLAECGRIRKSRFGQPKYYDVFAYGGAFRVHASRCLLFKNGEFPLTGTNYEYRCWGIPEFLRIKRDLRDSSLAHGYAVKMLERSVQSIYKVSGLANLLASEDGENAILKRMDTVDQSRGLFGTVAIDADGEDYMFQTFSLNGVKEIIDSTCEELSSVTNIPQSILFGRSPAGMDSTGKSDMEQFYSFIEHIQETMVKDNLTTLVDIIFTSAHNLGIIENVPDYKIEFDPLWSLTEQEQAQVDATKAQTESTKANTANVYVQMGALDPSEVREGLKKAEAYDIEDLVDESSDPIMSPNERQQLEQFKFQTYTGQGQQQMGGGMMPPMGGGGMPPMGGQPPMGGAPEQQDDEEQPQQQGAPDRKNNEDGNEVTCASVIVVDGNTTLCGRRSDNGKLCGGGGHIEDDETPEEAATRELWEEMGITAQELIPLGICQPEGYEPTAVYLCTKWSGDVKDSSEMRDVRFRSLDEFENVFEPFMDSIRRLLKNSWEKHLTKHQIGAIMNTDGEDFKESDHPRDADGKFTSGGGSHKKGGFPDSQKQKWLDSEKEIRDKAMTEAKTAYGKKKSNYETLASMPAQEVGGSTTKFRAVGDNGFDITRKTVIKNEAGAQRVYLMPCQFACIEVFAEGDSFRMAQAIADKHKKEGWKAKDLAHSKGYAMVQMNGKKPKLLEVHVMYNKATGEQFDWKLYKTKEAVEYLGGR